MTKSGIDDLTPILVGCGQLTERDADPNHPKDALDLIEEASRLAAADAGLGGSMFDKMDQLICINILAPKYPNAPRMLADRLGANPRHAAYTTIGGNTPQWVVNRTAAQIAAGEAELVLIAGGEALRTRLKTRGLDAVLEEQRTGSLVDDIDPPEIIGDPRDGTNDHEIAHGLEVPIQVYPMVENALRVHYGDSFDDHQRIVGEMYSGFTKVAAENPNAWFRTPKTPEEIYTPSADNRYIGFPYTKYMNSIIRVDQAAALVMTSVGKARALGIDPSKWIYIHGVADTCDHFYISDRQNFYSSPALRLGAEKALGMAGVGIGDIDLIDFYSCFPSAVQIARDEFGISRDDPRSLTVTGGLPFHGGPGNNYPTHSIATMMDKLRAAPEKRGVCTGLGWYVTKHAIGIYSAQPWEGKWQCEDPASYQPQLDAMDHPKFVRAPAGKATVETYTVLYGRDGPEKGVLFGRLENGDRFLANTAADRAVFDGMTSSECIGRTGTVRSEASASGGQNLFSFD